MINCANCSAVYEIEESGRDYSHFCSDKCEQEFYTEIEQTEDKSEDNMGDYQFKSNEFFEFLDGKIYERDGIEGKFTHQITNAVYPYKHTSQRLVWEATERGRETEEYQKVKQELRDHWVSDLTDCISEYIDIAYELGYRPNPLESENIKSIS